MQLMGLQIVRHDLETEQQWHITVLELIIHVDQEMQKAADKKKVYLCS